jgi:hypothetical protein
MEILSPEIILYILSFLPLDQLQKTSRVNKEFFSISRDISLWIQYAREKGITYTNQTTNNEETERDDSIRQKCLDEFILEKNWNGNKFVVQTLSMFSLCY